MRSLREPKVITCWRREPADRARHIQRRVLRCWRSRRRPDGSCAGGRLLLGDDDVYLWSFSIPKPLSADRYPSTPGLSREAVSSDIRRDSIHRIDPADSAQSADDRLELPQIADHRDELVPELRRRFPDIGDPLDLLRAAEAAEGPHVVTQRVAVYGGTLSAGSKAGSTTRSTKAPVR